MVLRPLCPPHGEMSKVPWYGLERSGWWAKVSNTSSLQRFDYETTPPCPSHPPLLVGSLCPYRLRISIMSVSSSRRHAHRLDGHDAAVGFRDMRGLEVDASCSLEDERCFVDRKGVREEWGLSDTSQYPPHAPVSPPSHPPGTPRHPSLPR